MYTTQRFIIVVILSCFFFACSNSDLAEQITNNTEPSENVVDSPSQKIGYLPIDDSEYPYAKIPRVVIETENYQAIKDRETEIPAKLQIWGRQEPLSEIMELTIKGRGNSSWGAPKKSYKIEFSQKNSILGMPQDRDWALIANYADKTLMKNYLMYNLSAELGAYYAPRCIFVELYLNRQYLGVYLLTETIKIAKKRINIPQNENSFVVEIDKKVRENEQKFFSYEITKDTIGMRFHVHYPKNASKNSLQIIESHVRAFEYFLKNKQSNQDQSINQWVDVNEYVKHYWIQEFSRNPDACFFTSVFFSWERDGVIKMGPVWDFDLAFGGHNIEDNNKAEGWFIKRCYWNRYAFQDSIIKKASDSFWKSNYSKFKATIDVIDSIQILLQNAEQNNFKKWRILQSTDYSYHSHSYDSYAEAVEDLKQWVLKRTLWINSHID